MSEKEYKIKCESLFKKNTVLLNQQKIDAEQIRALQKQNGELTDELAKKADTNHQLVEQIAKRGGEMTEYEKQVEISLCEKYLKYLRKPHWSWDIFLRPFRIMYYKNKLRKLSSQPKE